MSPFAASLPPVIDPWILVFYYLLLGALSLYGAHRLVLLWRLWRAQVLTSESGRRELPDAPLPMVTVQLPVFNEPAVAERLVRAVAALDWPAERLEIQVLDDSTDHTSRTIAIVVEELHRLRPELCIEHLQRTERHGYKAGALAWGLERACGELIAIFDADFVPASDFLRRLVPEFDCADVGMVQSRWAHLNRNRSLFTELQATLLDGHFAVEHAARCGAGLFFNFNGTAGIWRRRAIDEAGGWQHDTLTEDLDLSYRAQLTGWRFVFRNDYETPAELPTSIGAFRSQQRRWTQGSTQTLRKLAALWGRAELPLRVWLEGIVHVGSNLAYPLLVVLGALMPWAFQARHRLASDGLVAVDVALLLLGSVSLAAFYGCSQRRVGGSVAGAMLRFPALMALGIGMSVHNAAAALRGLFVAGGEFVRTPKSGDLAGAAESGLRPASVPTSQGRRPIALGPSWWVTVLLAVQLAVALAWAVVQRTWWDVPYLIWFLTGYGAITVGELHEQVVASRRRSSVERFRSTNSEGVLPQIDAA